MKSSTAAQIPLAQKIDLVFDAYLRHMHGVLKKWRFELREDEIPKSMCTCKDIGDLGRFVFCKHCIRILDGVGDFAPYDVDPFLCKRPDHLCTNCLCRIEAEYNAAVRRGKGPKVKTDEGNECQH